MNIDLTFDSSVDSAPAGFRTTVQAVATWYGWLFSDPVTLTIDVGYNEVRGLPLIAGSIGTSIGAAQYISYADLRSAMSADATTAADASAVASLPVSNPTGPGQIVIRTAEAKALGVAVTATDPYDGYVGFSSSTAFNYDPNNRAVAGQYDFFGVVAHEIAHAMGRAYGLSDNAYTVFDLFRYSASGVRSLSGGAVSYASVDGGATKLANFNTTSGGDWADWAASVAPDSFLAFLSPSVIEPVSPFDITVMDALGYTLSTGTAVTATSETEINLAAGLFGAGGALAGNGTSFSVTLANEAAIDSELAPFAMAAGSTLRLSGGALTGSGAVAVQSGVLDLGSANRFSGGVTIAGGAGLTASALGALGSGPIVDNGTLTVAVGGTFTFGAPITGSGSIAFSSGLTQTLKFASGAPTTSFVNFADGDAIDLAGLAFVAGDHLGLSGNALTVLDASNAIKATLTLVSPAALSAYSIRADSATGTLISRGAAISGVLTVTTTADYRSTPFSGVTGVQFVTAASASALFKSSQFGASGVSTTLAVTGDANPNQIGIVVEGTSFSAAGFSYSAWNSADSLVLYGGAVGSTLTGSSQIDAILAGPGNDTINAGAGDNYISAGAGNDVLLAGSGNDIGYGGAGNDYINLGNGADIVLAGDGNDTIFGGLGNQILFGEAGDDVIFTGDGDTFAAGGSGNDVIYGGGGNEYMLGGDGVNFFVASGAGHNTLVGGTGLNDLRGAAGTDSFFSSGSKDYLTGGGGTDYFYVFAKGAVANNQTFIMDWNAGGAADYIVLPTAMKASTFVFDQAGYTWIASTAPGGNDFLALAGQPGAANVQSHIIWT